MKIKIFKYNKKKRCIWMMGCTVTKFIKKKININFLAICGYWKVASVFLTIFSLSLKIYYLECLCFFTDLNFENRQRSLFHKFSSVLNSLYFSFLFSFSNSSFQVLNFLTINNYWAFWTSLWMKYKLLFGNSEAQQSFAKLIISFIKQYRI